MHRITKFNLDNAYADYVDTRIISIMREKIDDYNAMIEAEEEMYQNALTYEELNSIKEEKKRKYLEILYSNPCGFKLTAAMTTNYRQLKTIYHQRKNHRLPEWREFCEQIEQLPYFKELVLGENK
jgi:hypothetical protein